MVGKASYLGIGFLLVATSVLLACSGAETKPATSPAPVGTAATGAEGEPPPTPTSTPVPPAALAIGVISTDLGAGVNRLVFFLLDSDSEPIKTPDAQVSIYFPAEATGSAPRQVVTARFHPWPLGGLGVYSAMIDLDQAGNWGLRVVVPGPDGSARSARVVFRVKEKSGTPPIGSLAPLSKNRTRLDVATLEELTTARPPDPELYSMTIADAVASGKPLVVVFATPAFCETATCGPQVEVVRRIKDRYKDRANFIHVEIFENPHEIQGDLSRARTAAAVEEWGLSTEPWTFIVDRQGRLAAKFEAFTTEEEIEQELKAVLQ